MTMRMITIWANQQNKSAANALKRWRWRRHQKEIIRLLCIFCWAPASSFAVQSEWATAANYYDSSCPDTFDPGKTRKNLDSHWQHFFFFFFFVCLSIRAPPPPPFLYGKVTGRLYSWTHPQQHYHLLLLLTALIISQPQWATHSLYGMARPPPVARPSKNSRIDFFYSDHEILDRTQLHER